MADENTETKTETENETESNPIADLIGNVSNKEFNAADTIFKDLMKSRVDDALEAEKVNQADIIFNGETEEEEDTSTEDESETSSESSEAEGENSEAESEAA